MYPEILAFIFTTSGWFLVSSTLVTDYWKLSTLDGTVVATVVHYSNLWKLCVTDFIGVSDCKDFPSMLALDGHIQACRGLMIAAVCLSFFGSTFALVGMKCTKIGGTDKTKARIACYAGVNFTLSGLCSFASCSLYAHKITTEFFDPNFVELKYDFGVALFIGWSGSFLSVLGGSIFCFSIADSFTKSQSSAKYIYKGAASHSHMSSHLGGQAMSLKPESVKYRESSRIQHFDT
ncbi:claudin-10-like [Centropristis striata]|uniref:claudin-10-like n=1 Tax=Centropristis striata TaxID=184440 RepID=UPI0027E21513|nr:claudin-10-like [Centropristis striata]